MKFRVISDSMLPLIKIGSDLEIYDKSEFSAFDIILFKRYDQLFVHYVWRNQTKFNNTVITRSLKNYLQDEEPVEIRDIVGFINNYKISAFTKIKIVFICFLKGAL